MHGHIDVLLRFETSEGAMSWLVDAGDMDDESILKTLHDVVYDYLESDDGQDFRGYMGGWIDYAHVFEEAGDLFFEMCADRGITFLPMDHRILDLPTDPLDWER